MKIYEMGERGKNTQRKKRGRKEEISAAEYVPAKKSAGKKTGVERTEINLVNDPSWGKNGGKTQKVKLPHNIVWILNSVSALLAEWK